MNRVREKPAMNALTPPRLLLEAYLAWENEPPETHEFHRGEVFAMVGARRAQGRVAANVARELGGQLKGSPCQVFTAGMKVRIGEDSVLYPDVFVTCDKADLATGMIFRWPKRVVEVPSPSTQACERSPKFALDRRIPSLQDYILVDPETRRVEALRRGADGLWDLHDMGGANAMEAASIGGVVPMAEVFAGIDPPASA